LANGKAPPVLPTAEKFLLNVEGLNDVRTLLADFSSILLGAIDSTRTAMLITEGIVVRSRSRSQHDFLA
jgi:hypothetical protein